jgi:hypothetical protein
MRKFSITTLLLGALVMVFSARPARAQINVSVTIGGFYDELAPYGRWFDCSYGQCWAPERVATGWQPYTNGQWIYTEYGWTWVSDDPWGGNPYHYGTWTLLDRYGWCWVPGVVWAPAWVTWSYSDRYVGWAPLPPNISFGSSGYSGRAVTVNPSRYVFVPTNRFVGTSVSSVRVSSQQNATIFRQTRPVTRFSVSGGIVRNMAIPMATVQRATGGRIETRNISEARATPRSMSAGSRRVAVIAPAQEVKAAAAARQHKGSTSAAPSEQRAPKTQVKEKQQRPNMESRKGSTYQSAPAQPKQKEQRPLKARQPSSGESRGQSAQPKSQPRQESPRTSGRAETRSSEPDRKAAHETSSTRKEASQAPAHAEARPSESRHNAAPAERSQQPPARVEGSPQGHRGPGQAGKPAQSKPGSKTKKPAEKDEGQKDKGGKDKNEEKH